MVYFVQVSRSSVSQVFFSFPPIEEWKRESRREERRESRREERRESRREERIAGKKVSYEASKF